MTVHYECSHWRPVCDVRAGDVLDYDPDEGALCPECGEPLTVYIETLSITRVDSEVDA